MTNERDRTASKVFPPPSDFLDGFVTDTPTTKEAVRRLQRKLIEREVPPKLEKDLQ